MPRFLWLLPALALLSGCDRFFGMGGDVTDCSTKKPIAGAAVHLVVGNDDKTEVTDEKGHFSLFANEPDDASAEVTISHEGYKPLPKHYDGSPSGNQALCLEPLAP